MSSSLYDQMRASDLRHEYPHALAEMVADLQATTDKVASYTEEVTKGLERTEKLAAYVSTTAAREAHRLKRAEDSVVGAIDSAKNDLIRVINELPERSVAVLEQQIDTMSMLNMNLLKKVEEIQKSRAALQDHERLVNERIAEERAAIAAAQADLNRQRAAFEREMAAARAEVAAARKRSWLAKLLG